MLIVVTLFRMLSPAIIVTMCFSDQLSSWRAFLQKGTPSTGQRNARILHQQVSPPCHFRPPCFNANPALCSSNPCFPSDRGHDFDFLHKRFEEHANAGDSPIVRALAEACPSMKSESRIDEDDSVVFGKGLIMGNNGSPRTIPVEQSA